MLYIVRHGQTDWNVLGKRQGHVDNPLNETGIKQAKELQLLLKDISFDKVFSSPLKRAIDTAKIITNKKIIVDERLIERNNGKLEGLTKEQIKKIKDSGNYDDKSYGVETPEEMQNRAERFLKEILEKYPNQDILVVTHCGLIINMRCYLDGVPNDLNSYMVDNCEVYKYSN